MLCVKTKLDAPALNCKFAINILLKHLTVNTLFPQIDIPTIEQWCQWTLLRKHDLVMQTLDFENSLEQLITIAKEKVTVIMCAEAVPWHCHRSLIGDALLVRGFKVEDIMSDRTSTPHKLTSWARVDGSTITYPGEVPRRDISWMFSWRRLMKLWLCRRTLTQETGQNTWRKNSHPLGIGAFWSDAGSASLLATLGLLKRCFRVPELNPPGCFGLSEGF